MCSVNNEILTHFGKFVSDKVKKSLRKSQAQFWEKVRKLRQRQNYGFLLKKRVQRQALVVEVSPARKKVCSGNRAGYMVIFSCYRFDKTG